MEMQTIVVLLTITVILLSFAILTLLGTVIALLIKVRKIAESIEQVTVNVVSATEWLSVTKVIGEVAKLFRK